MRSFRGEDIKSILIKLASPEQMLGGVVRINVKDQEKTSVSSLPFRQDVAPTSNGSIGKDYVRLMIDGSGRLENKTSLQCLTIH